MKKVFLLSSFVILAFVSFVAAQPQCDCPMPKELNLTDTQQDQFEKISFDMQKKQIDLRAKLETVTLELRRLMTAESIDKSAIEKKMTEGALQRVALRINHITAWSG
ncbi:MAG: periplasmic heavy metal sensor, partial [Bacteroidota bacterium]